LAYHEKHEYLKGVEGRKRGGSRHNFRVKKGRKSWRGKRRGFLDFEVCFARGEGFDEEGRAISCERSIRTKKGAFLTRGGGTELASGGEKKIPGGGGRNEFLAAGGLTAGRPQDCPGGMEGGELRNPVRRGEVGQRKKEPAR